MSCSILFQRRLKVGRLEVWWSPRRLPYHPRKEEERCGRGMEPIRALGETKAVCFVYTYDIEIHMYVGPLLFAEP